MEVKTYKNSVVLNNVPEFEPKHIFENGQCFRWERQEDGSYTIVAMNRVINVGKVNGSIILDNCTLDDFNNIWYSYFDMDRDYVSLRRELSKKDEHLRLATEFGEGLRITNQDIFEMVISFIISANNQIPRIKKAVDTLSTLCGKEIGNYRGKTYYAFPKPEDIASISDENLAALKIGFRAPYIVKTAKMIVNKEVDITSLVNMEYEEAHKELTKLFGVGPKVADCILLFGVGKDIAFPVDTWVIKIMNEYYHVNEHKNMKKIKNYGIELFGEKAGLAQQYLFYYAREHKLKEEK